VVTLSLATPIVKAPAIIGSGLDAAFRNENKRLSAKLMISIGAIEKFLRHAAKFALLIYL
jgi:hypothetical protein